MLSQRALRLVLITSCAHALVHVFELSLPSVELKIADFYGVDKAMTGLLTMPRSLPPTTSIRSFLAGERGLT